MRLYIAKIQDVNLIYDMQKDQRIHGYIRENNMEWTEDKIKRLKIEVADRLEIDIDWINPSARIKEDLGADSLDMYELYYMLDAEFDITESEDRMSELKTVQNFIDLFEITPPDSVGGVKYSPEINQEKEQ